MIGPLLKIAEGLDVAAALRGLPPHFDGIDRVSSRRYQLALRSEAGG